MPQKEGFVILESEVLGERIVVLWDDKRIEDALETGLVVYRKPEVELLEGLSEQAIKDVHKIKKTFKGWVWQSDSPTKSEKSQSETGDPR